MGKTWQALVPGRGIRKFRKANIYGKLSDPFPAAGALLVLLGSSLLSEVEEDDTLLLFSCAEVRTSTNTAFPISAYQASFAKMPAYQLVNIQEVPFSLRTDNSLQINISKKSDFCKCYELISCVSAKPMSRLEYMQLYGEAVTIKEIDQMHFHIHSLRGILLRKHTLK